MDKKQANSTKGQIKRITVSAVVKRADGTIEDHGIIADTSLWAKVKTFFIRLIKKDYRNGITVYGTQL